MNSLRGSSLEVIIHKEDSMIPKAQFLKNYEEFNNIVDRPLSEKIEQTRAIIKKALSFSENPAVACSWGKDSYLMLHFILPLKPDIPVLFANTGVEFPETLRFRDRILSEMDINYYEVKPSKGVTFWTLANEYGYPGESRWRSIKNNYKGVPKCCLELKERPAKRFYKEHDIDLTFVGLTYTEGRLRRTKIIESGPIYYVKSQKINKCLPICYWSEDQVFEYSSNNNLPMNEGYKVSPRIGCMPCTGHLNWEQEMAKANFKMYMKVCKDLGRPPLEAFI